MCFVLRAGSFLNVSLENIFKIVLDDKAYSAETGLPCIIETEIHDDVSLLSDLIKLFISAVSAAHACSHDNKNRFHIIFSFH